MIYEVQAKEGAWEGGKKGFSKKKTPFLVSEWKAVLNFLDNIQPIQKIYFTVMISRYSMKHKFPFEGPKYSIFGQLHMAFKLLIHLSTV